MAGGSVTNGTLAQSESQAKDIWRIREGISEALVRRGAARGCCSLMPLTWRGQTHAWDEHTACLRTISISIPSKVQGAVVWVCVYGGVRRVLFAVMAPETLNMLPVLSRRRVQV